MKKKLKLLIFYHHQIFWANKFSTRIFNQKLSPTPSITISFCVLYTFYSDFCSCFLFFSVAPLKIVVSEAVFGMDDGRSSDAGRPRLPGVCIVDVDSNAEPYWLLLVFLPKRARVCSNQLTACPINTGALISLSLSLLLAFFATAADAASVSCSRRAHSPLARSPMEHVRQWARDWWRVQADARLLLAGWDINVCILCFCVRGRDLGCRCVRLCVCHFASRLQQHACQGRFCNRSVLAWLTEFFSVIEPDLFTDILLSRQKSLQ